MKARFLVAGPGLRPALLNQFITNFLADARCRCEPATREMGPRDVLRQLRSRTGGPGSLPRDDTIKNYILKCSRTARSLRFEDRTSAA